MSELASLQDLRLEQERRRRARLREEGPLYDWYGPDCGCPVENRKIDGSCPKHPRAREKQRIPDGDWDVWLIRSGRGFGKTRTGAEWLRFMAENGPERAQYGLIGATASDVRDIMIQGVSGILRISPPWFMPVYEPSKRSITWPNGTRALCYSSESPRDFRGPGFHGVWGDEFAKWSHLEECWDNLQFGMRQVCDEDPEFQPRTCLTTTPLPLKLIKELIADPFTRVVDGSTYENAANLAKRYIAKIRAKYEGTRFGQQEIYGRILDDVVGALWTTDVLDCCRCSLNEVPDLARVVIGVDPSVADPKSDPEREISECGIVASGMAMMDHPLLNWTSHGYVLQDHSLTTSPRGWAAVAIEAYHQHNADCVAVEVNNGGAMARDVIQLIDGNIPVEMLHASRGKHTRAEPIASLYEQGRVFHVRPGDFAKLEEQMTTWVPGMKSPDRMDALVWSLTESVVKSCPLETGQSPLADFRGS